MRRKRDIYSKLLLVPLIIRSVSCTDDWTVPAEDPDEKFAR